MATSIDRMINNDILTKDSLLRANTSLSLDSETVDLLKDLTQISMSLANKNPNDADNLLVSDDLIYRTKEYAVNKQTYNQKLGQIMDTIDTSYTDISSQLRRLNNAAKDLTQGDMPVVDENQNEFFGDLTQDSIPLADRNQYQFLNDDGLDKPTTAIAELTDNVLTDLTELNEQVASTGVVLNEQNPPLVGQGIPKYYVRDVPLLLVSIAASVAVMDLNEQTAQVTSNIAKSYSKVLSELSAFQGFVAKINSMYKSVLNEDAAYQQNQGENPDTTLDWDDDMMAYYFLGYCYQNPLSTGQYAGSIKNSDGKFVLSIPSDQVPDFLQPYMSSASVNRNISYNYQYYWGAKSGTIYDIALPPYYDASGTLVVSVKYYENKKGPSTAQYTTVTVVPGGDPGEKSPDVYKDATIKLPDGGPTIKLSDILSSYNEAGYIGSTSISQPTGNVSITSDVLVSFVNAMSAQIAMIVPDSNLSGSWADGLTNSSRVDAFSEQLANLNGTINSLMSTLSKNIATNQNAVQQMMNYFSSMNQIMLSISSQIYSNS